MKNLLSYFNIKTSILIVLNTIVSNLYSQNYDSLVKPGKTWNYLCLHSSEPTSGYFNSIQILDSFFVYNGHSYNIVSTNHRLSIDNSDTMLVREEDKKVWFLHIDYPRTQNREILVYDFNLEQGDTFDFRLINEWNNESFKIIKKVVVKTYMENNRKVIEFSGGIKWIEGIGISRATTLYYSYLYELFGEYRCYICVYDSGRVIYPYNGICDSTVKTKPIKNNSLNIYPNPNKNHFLITTTSANKIEIEFYNSLGRKIDTVSLQGSLSYNLAHNYLKGSYYMKVIDHGISTYYKLLIE